MNNEEQLSLQELRRLQFNGLLYLKNICEKNNIVYYIISGTLLGAVKYNGYIPWDDDIDIALKRSEYIRLIKVLEEDNNSDYEVLTMYNTKDYYYPYAKLVSKKTKLVDNAKEINKLGVFVDIFPMDCFNEEVNSVFKRTRFIRNLTSKRMKIKNAIKKTKLLESKEHKVSYLGFKNFIYNVVDVLSRPLGYNFWVKRLDKELSKYKDGKYIGILYIDNFAYFDVTLFDNIAEYTFENNKFTSIKDYDLYLRKLYGDYRQDPPKSKQMSHHQIKAYWRNNEK